MSTPTTESIYSTHIPGIKEAAVHLVNKNSEELLRYLYSHSDEDPFNDPCIRIGLAIRILVKVDKQIDEEVIQRIMKDIETLRSDKEYLRSCENPEQRYQALQEEYLLVQKFIDWEDKITLNTRDDENNENSEDDVKGAENDDGDENVRNDEIVEDPEKDVKDVTNETTKNDGDAKGINKECKLDDKGSTCIFM